MTLTFLDLYNECASQPWSMYDNEAESNDDVEAALKISINKAISFLWNYQPWTFRINKSKIRTKANKAEYDMPNGKLVRKVISGLQTYGVKYENNLLPFEPDYEILDDKEVGEVREPKSFYVTGDNLYIYPTPDTSYTINLEYLLLPYGLNEDGDEIYELNEETDYINIPEKYEALFKNCLISKAMIYAIDDETDENYSGYVTQYEEALSTMMQYCLDSLVDRFIVW